MLKIKPKDIVKLESNIEQAGHGWTFKYSVSALFPTLEQFD